MLETYKQDRNKAYVERLNLVFRSVGGSVGSNLDLNTTQLEEMDDEEWASVVTDVVDDMRYISYAHVLFCAYPDGAVYPPAVASKRASETVDVTPSSFGAREYGKIYQAFWTVLGTMAWTEGVGSNDDDDDELDQTRMSTASMRKSS